MKLGVAGGVIGLVVASPVLVAADATFSAMQGAPVIVGPEMLMEPRVGVYAVVLLSSWLIAGRVGAKVQRELSEIRAVAQDVIALRKWHAHVHPILVEHAQRQGVPIPPGLDELKKEA